MFSPQMLNRITSMIKQSLQNSKGASSGGGSGFVPQLAAQKVVGALKGNALKMKKGGTAKKSSDAMGRAVKRKTADAKGRAMKKGK